ncbi:MAG TPA: hypothetical protein VIJ60_09845 [Acidimicrobiales bacterium]
MTISLRRRAGTRPSGRVAVALVPVVALLVATGLAVPVAPAGAARVSAPPSANWGASVPGAAACNPLGGSTCLVPFPSDYYTVVDRSMPSGRKVVFPESAMPTNRLGMHISPATYSRNDGFSPGTSILVHLAGVNLARSGIPGVGAIGASLRPTAGVVLLDETTGKRLPYWGELDARDSDPSTQLLMVHPAANLPEGHRIAVALTGVRTANGVTVPPNPAFAAVLGRRAAPAGVTGAFLRHERALVTYLHGRGVPTGSLTTAWDFTVISTQNLTGYAIHMRDVAMGQLGTGAPSFTVTKVTNFTKAENGSDARQVTGTFEVPSFLDEPGGPYGSTLNLGPTGLPQQLPGNLQTAVFSCLIPRSTVANTTPGDAGPVPVTPGRPVLYGVGLFNVATKIGNENVSVMADHYDMVLCSTNWEGLTGNEEIPDAALLADLSNFTTLPDHLTQSLINALYLGRLMSSPRGFDSSPAFRQGGTAFIKTSAPLTYYGNSEGSLAGGALTAISTVFRRAVLGVPSMDYDVLLDRSSDFVAFNDIFEPAYPGSANQQVVFDLLQMLWDRGETDGYAEQMTGGLPGTPSHQVLLQMGFGDHQVSNFTTVTEARTIGASVHTPTLAAGRFPGNLFYGLPAIKRNPYRGSAALYVWDPGVPAPTTADEPPTAGADPHQTVPRQVPAAQFQLNQFQLTGRVPNVCGNQPCRAAVHGHELTG